MSKLSDYLITKQVYIESLKNGFNADFRKQLPKLVKELKKLLSKYNREEISKRKIDSFVKAVSKIANRHYSVWLSELLIILKELVSVSAETSLLVASRYPRVKDDEEKERPIPFVWLSAYEIEKIFNLIKGKDIPAVGVSLTDYLNTMPIYAAAKVEQMLKAGISSNYTAKELIDSVVGTSTNNYKDGVLLKLSNNADSIADTAMQHTDAFLTAGILAIISNKYRWISIIDNRTSNICRYRNRRIYNIGKGPLPPAHIRCRSTIVPVMLGESTSDESFQSWLARQSEDMQKHVLGGKYNLWASGKLKDLDFPKFNQITPLSVSRFKSKMDELSTR